jgi:hypothetical protein
MTTPMKRPEFDKLCADTFALLGARFDSPAARAMLWAIGRQEGRMHYRRQIGGPARGLWQFERGGGVRGVLLHPSSKAHAEALCKARSVEASAAAVYPRLETDDVLACGFARLLLFTDPSPLPAPVASSLDAAWAYYIRNWRPGKPHLWTWGEFWKEAVEMVR